MESVTRLLLASLITLTIIAPSVNGQNQSKPRNPQYKPANNQNGNQQAIPAHEEDHGGTVGTQTGQPEKSTAQPEPKPFLTHGEWVISALTLVYVIISFFGLLAIKRQADIAKQQADNITNSERAWVTVSVEIHSDHGDYDVVLTNHGSTPARIVEARGDLQPLHKGNSLPDSPSYQTDILPAKKLLAPKEEWSIHTFSPHPTVRHVPGGTERLDTEQFFIGYVAYRHIFDPEKSPPHYSRFCFHLQVNRTWQASGPSAYHEYS